LHSRRGQLGLGGLGLGGLGLGGLGLGGLGLGGLGLGGLGLGGLGPRGGGLGGGGLGGSLDGLDATARSELWALKPPDPPAPPSAAHPLAATATARSELWALNPLDPPAPPSTARLVAATATASSELWAPAQPPLAMATARWEPAQWAPLGVDTALPAPSLTALNLAIASALSGLGRAPPEAPWAAPAPQTAASKQAQRAERAQAACSRACKHELAAHSLGGEGHGADRRLGAL